MARLTVKTEVETHPFHQALGVPSGVSTFEIPEHINLILSRIFLADCQQLSFIAALRDSESHSFRLDVGELTHDNFAIVGSKTAFYLVHGQRQNGGDRLFEPALVLQRHGAHNRSVANMHVVDKNVAAVVVDAEHIDLADRSAHYRAVGLIAGEHIIFDLKLLSFLEAEGGGKTLHLAAEKCHQSGHVAAENLPDALDLSHIFVVVDLPDTRSSATLQMIFETEASAPPGHIVGRERQAAGAQRIEIVDKAEHGLGHGGVGVGAVVASAAALAVARQHDARKIFIGDDDPGI
ncbi:unknown [Prevotella sp. CAG:1031]|nr:unknown [Prevotella sp. CAG:1031]